MRFFAKTTHPMINDNNLSKPFNDRTIITFITNTKDD